MHAIARAGPDIAVFVDGHAVAITWLDFGEYAAAGQRQSITDRKNADKLLRIVRSLIACFGNIERPFVGREGQSVWTVKVRRRDPDVTGRRVEAIKRRRLFRQLRNRIMRWLTVTPAVRLSRKSPPLHC